MSGWKMFGIAVAGSAVASVVVVPLATWATYKILTTVNAPKMAGASGT